MAKVELPKGEFRVQNMTRKDREIFYDIGPARGDCLRTVFFLTEDEGKPDSTEYREESLRSLLRDSAWKIVEGSKGKIHTGGSSSYYMVEIKDPTSGGAPYTAECNDIIEALNMTFAQANIFKAIWRSAAAENLGLEKAGNNEVYDAEKMVFFSDRNLKRAKRRAENA